jgi:hypothetical protein
LKLEVVEGGLSLVGEGDIGMHIMTMEGDVLRVKLLTKRRKLLDISYMLDQSLR